MKIVAYEFYFRDPQKGYNFVGILPERRKDPKRIDKDSIREWEKKIIGKGIDSKELFFTQVTIDRDTGRIIHPNTSL